MNLALLVPLLLQYHDNSQSSMNEISMDLTHCALVLWYHLFCVRLRCRINHCQSCGTLSASALCQYFSPGGWLHTTLASNQDVMLEVYAPFLGAKYLFVRYAVSPAAVCQQALRPPHRTRDVLDRTPGDVPPLPRRSRGDRRPAVHV